MWFVMASPVRPPALMPVLTLRLFLLFMRCVFLSQRDDVPKSW